MANQRSPISPTAHYTGAVWASNGLSHPAFHSAAGGLMYNAMRLPMAITKALGGTKLEELLLARHRLLDRRLERAIESGEVSQVIEIAAGLSARGWRFSRRYGNRITYVETDLPEMVALKRRALREAGSIGPHHRVVTLDALQGKGEQSLGAIAATLDRERGLAIVSEGLLSYLERDAVIDLWRRAAGTLSAFRSGVMLSDLHLTGDNDSLVTAIGIRLLSTFVRGQVGFHFADRAEAVAALKGAGFADAVLRSGSEASRAPGARSIHVIEAETRSAETR